MVGMVIAALVMIPRPSSELPGSPGGGADDPGFVVVDATEPQVSVFDLGVSRGDGLFESISVINGHAQAMEPHLLRLAHSAQLMDLPKPDLDVWRRAVLAAVTLYQRDAPKPVTELLAKLVMTRGIEGSGEPTGWVYVAEIDDFRELRKHGMSVVTLDRGYRHDVAQTSPWLLQGAKTLSYAVNKSVLREAERRHADDVIFVSSDGFALEGPTSTLIVRNGNRIRTPQTDQGILAGTTQVSVFEFFDAHGFETSYEHIPVTELRDADALWLVSSVRQAAPIRELDGKPIAVDTLSDDLNRFLLSRTS